MEKKTKDAFIKEGKKLASKVSKSAKKLNKEEAEERNKRIQENLSSIESEGFSSSKLKEQAKKAGKG